MSDTDFDTALVNAAFRLAGEEGWSRVTVPAAARAAGLSLAEARERFPSKTTILLRFGRLADQMALRTLTEDGAIRDRLFDLLMCRLDFFQSHRAGMKALLRALPMDPGLALMLASATRRSMRWLLQAAGLSAAGVRGELQVQGLFAVWLWAIRAWERDESEDLSATMAAVDNALHRAEQASGWLYGRSGSLAPPPPPVAEGAGELDPSAPSPPSDVSSAEAGWPSAEEPPLPLDPPASPEIQGTTVPGLQAGGPSSSTGSQQTDDPASPDKPAAPKPTQ